MVFMQFSPGPVDNSEVYGSRTNVKWPEVTVEVLDSLCIATFFADLAPCLNRNRWETSHPPTPLQVKVAVLDAKLAWHREQIPMLIAERNKIIPVSGLPNELLIKILAVYAVISAGLFNL